MTIGAIKVIDPVTEEEITGGPFSLANLLPPGGLTVDPNSRPPGARHQLRATAGTGETSKAFVVFERLVDGSIGDSIALVDETGNTVQGVDVNGTGVDQVNPEARAQGCTVIGTRRGEALTGTPGNDVICALAGNDRVIDRSGLRDKLFGNSGRDRLNAKDRDCDMLNGVGGRDTCFKNRGDISVVFTCTSPKPTSLGSTVRTGSAASEGFARMKTASRAARVAASTTALVPMTRMPSRVKIVVFIERLRFYGR